jgi:CDGSH-type Zn-finger protein
MFDIEIIVRSDGPLFVTGRDIILKDQHGNRFDLSGREKIALCRCGHSEDKPFCDGSHKRCEFVSQVAARAMPPPKAPAPPPPVTGA